MAGMVGLGRKRRRTKRVGRRRRVVAAAMPFGLQKGRGSSEIWEAVLDLSSAGSEKVSVPLQVVSSVVVVHAPQGRSSCKQGKKRHHQTN